MILSVAENVWEVARSNFSEEEKQDLRKAIVGEAVCPRKFYVDLNKLPLPLYEKAMKFFDIKNSEIL